MIRAAIFGGTGYGGMELLRYLVGHSGVEVSALTSRSEDGAVADRHPHLRGFTDLRFTKEDDAVRLALARENDVVFWAKPHGVAAGEIPAVLDAVPGVRVIDLSGDFRLQDPALYDEWYGFTHPDPARLPGVAYGLAECGHADAIREARFVANPGCHATATAMAIWPAATAGLLEGRVSVTSVTGSSGGGSRPKQGSHHPERFTNLKAYRPLHHQHMPEVVQALGGQVVDFVPQSGAFARGIYVTAFLPLANATSDVAACYAQAYGAEPFVRLLSAPPELRAVVGTNLVDVHVTQSADVAVVTLAIDNLGKGMAGSAVQNLNLMFGLDPRAGLDRPGAGL